MQSLRSPFYDESGKTPAARIRQARIKKGLSIKELSEITGISTTSISKMENNHSRPSLPNLRILAQVLDVPISFLGCFEDLPEQTIGQKIKKARLYHGFTKEEFAQRIGVNVKTLRKWETGYFEPLHHHLDALAPYFNVLNTEDYH